MFKKIQQVVRALSKYEFAKASVYYVIANIIGQGIVLLSSAIFTRMMSKADFGLVSTYNTWVLVINTFICLNLFTSVRTAYVDFREDYDNYNSSVLMLAIISGVAMTAIITGTTVISGMNFGVGEVLLACLQSVALNVINYIMAIQSMKNEYKNRTFMMIAPNWTHTILSVLLMLLFTGNLYLAKISGNSVGLLVYGVSSAYIIFCKARPRIIPRYWKYALLLSVPTIFHTLSDLILMQSDRLMLTNMVGAEETAEYSVIYNVSSIVVAIYQAINAAWLPWFFERLKEEDSTKTRRYQRYYMILFTVFSCGMMTVSPELIKFMSPKNYWDGIRYLAPIVIASYLIFLYSFFSSYLLYKKRTVRIAVNTIIAAVMNLILNFYLIPQYKAVGAVVATVISYIVLFLLHFLSVLRDGRQYFSILNMFIYLLCMSGFGILFYLIRDYWGIRYGLFILLIGLVYIFKGRHMMSWVMGDLYENKGHKEG